MVSSWKINRELGRLGQQLRGLAERLTDPVAQRRLDRTVAVGLPRTDGILPLAEKIALFLLYQPAGLTDTTLDTCRKLSQAGYAPLVVSNALLTIDDRNRLKDVVWRAVERPNFGYDFGGYRDGLTCLRQWGIAPSELLILNDSIWFAVLPETDLMDRLALEPAEIAGSILRTRGSEHFLESYLYRLRRPALEHPEFLAFWKNLKLTSNKYYVIRRGERGFSAAMRAAGLRIAGVYDSALLPVFMEQQNDRFLRLTLRYAAYVDVNLAADADQLLQGDGPEWRLDVLTHIHKVLVKRQGYSSFPFAYMHLMGYPLLKKSSDQVSKAWRQAYLRAVEASDIPVPSIKLLTEIRDVDL
jgi:hypothetical protein